MYARKKKHHSVKIIIIVKHLSGSSPGNKLFFFPFPSSLMLYHVKIHEINKMTHAFSSSFIFRNWKGMTTDGRIEDCKAQTMRFGPNTAREETIQAAVGKKKVIKKQITASVTFKP